MSNMSNMSKITFDVKGEASGHQCIRDAVGMEDGPSLSVKRPLGNRGNPATVSKMSESATPKAHVMHRKTLQVL